MGTVVRGIDYVAGQSFTCYKNVNIYTSEDGTVVQGSRSKGQQLFFHSISAHANQSWSIHDYKLAANSAAGYVVCFVDEDAFPYGVYYDLNGGSGSVPAFSEKIYQTNLSMPSNPTRTGYGFAGWRADNNGAIYTTSSPYNVEASTTLRAQWNPNTYTLTLNPNGGTLTGASSYSVRYSTADYWSLSWCIPTRPGHQFLGWYTAASGGTQIYDANGNCTNDGTYWVNSAWMYLGGLTVYAHWLTLTATITFDPNGGSIPYTEGTYSIGSTISLPGYAECSRRGAVFLGWGETLSAVSYAPGGSYLVEEDNELFAIWRVGDIIWVKAGNSGSLNDWKKSQIVYIKYQGQWLGG